MPDFTFIIGLSMLLAGITMCATLSTVLLWLHDRDVAIMTIPLTLILLAATLASVGYITPAIVILSVITLARLRGYVLKRWGDYTIACLLFRQHEWCDQHLRCTCPHHDLVIHEAMAEPTLK